MRLPFGLTVVRKVDLSLAGLLCHRLSVIKLEIDKSEIKMNDEQRRSHAMQQLRAARELYSETGDRVYLAVIDAHLRTIAEVDARRRAAEARREALMKLLQQANGEGSRGDSAFSSMREREQPERAETGRGQESK